jgi:hypothetical protein
MCSRTGTAVCANAKNNNDAKCGNDYSDNFNSKENNNALCSSSGTAICANGKNNNGENDNGESCKNYYSDNFNGKESNNAVCASSGNAVDANCKNYRSDNFNSKEDNNAVCTSSGIDNAINADSRHVCDTRLGRWLNQRGVPASRLARSCFTDTGPSSPVRFIVRQISKQCFSMTVEDDRQGSTH